MIDIANVTVQATEKVMKLTGSVIALARVLKVKPAELAIAVMDRESNDDYRAAMVAFAVPAALEAAKEAEELKKKEAKKE